VHNQFFPGKKLSARIAFLLAAVIASMAAVARAQTNDIIPTFQIKADQVTAHVSPMLHGLMTEEINFSYEGGLYGELVRNRTFKANATNVVFWNPVGNGSISLDTTAPLSDTLNISLKLDASAATKSSPAGIANAGFWGIPVRPKTEYHASFYAKSDGKFTGPLTVALVSTNGATNFANAKVSGITGDWKKYEVTLTTKNVAPSKDNQLVITATSPGTIWFQQVSLFPPTYKNRANGNRPDIMQLLADMKPAFLRFPGGNYLEGNTYATRFNWKTTVGDISQRPGHLDDGWGYWSTDGMGLLEFLNWCEDLKIQPVLAVYAAYSMRQGAVTNELDACVQDALDEIEYVTGDTKTKWGAQRAKDGHKAPFNLEYVEIGNEDNLGSGGRTYDARFTQFYDAIKAKYPSLKIISTAPSTTKIVTTRTPDATDDHFYRNAIQMQSDSHHYDNYDRSRPKIFVGEWATREGAPTPNMNAALGDAAWMIGMERNSDAVIMSCYAPLLVNVSDIRLNNGNPVRGGSMQWLSDLIGYDTLTSYGSPPYYAQKMFANYCGDVILAMDAKDIPMKGTQTPGRQPAAGVDQPRPAGQQMPSLFSSVTRDSKTGTIYLKVVNTLGTPQPVKIEITGAATVESKGTATVLKANSPTDTNSIKEPVKIIPVTEKVSGLGANFTRTFPPYSITVLELKAK
jgi:alpha-L-arabinofuranosidase